MASIKQLRKSKNMTQKELAKQLGVNQTAVSQWERGITVPRRPMCIKLANLFGVSPQEILAPLQGHTENNVNSLEEELLRYFRLLDPMQQQREVARLQLLAEQAEAENDVHKEDNAAM